jgi:hypothetical protein
VTTTKENVSNSVRTLMRLRGMSSMSELAELLDMNPEYMPRKVREGRWLLEDLDALSAIFGVTVSAIVSGEDLAKRPYAPGPEKQKLFEVTFSLEGGAKLVCLEEAASSGDAIKSITGVWAPPEEVTNISTKEKRYFQVHIPSLEGK